MRGRDRCCSGGEDGLANAGDRHSPFPDQSFPDWGHADPAIRTVRSCLGAGSCSDEGEQRIGRDLVGNH